MKFNPNDYNSNAVMHCETQEEARIFCNFLRELDLNWCDGTSYINTYYNVYKQSMCYNFHDGRYGSMSFYQSNNFRILEFSDFDWDATFKVEEPVKLKFTW